MDNLTTFLEQSDKKITDLEHRRKINNNIDKYNISVESGKKQFIDLELARERASVLKSRVVENLDKYLMEFETNFTKQGGKLIWATNKEDCLNEIIKILQKKHTKVVVKSKSMITEEIDLNDFLENHGIEVVETDLGEFIVQLAGQKPYHIVTPAMHMSKEDVSELFHNKLNIPKTEDARKLTLTARELLREKYLKAEVGITGANFLLADVGGVAITENEGNARLTTTFPKTHIVIAGIEKIIPTWLDLSLFWPLLATRGTGQNVTVYNTIITGPRQNDEVDGPLEMYLILLDNGRTNLLAKEDKRDALKCIRCGACLNVCPVYKNIGGHTYNTTYSGPIGAIITPHLKDMEEMGHLSFASTLCGGCTEVCPVKIDIHNILLLNRKESVKLGLSKFSEKTAIFSWKTVMKSRKNLNTLKSITKNFFLKQIFKKTWGRRRNFPLIAPKSFSQLWEGKNNSA